MMDIFENILTITGIIGLVYGFGSWLYYHKIKFYLRRKLCIELRHILD